MSRQPIIVQIARLSAEELAAYKVLRVLDDIHAPAIFLEAAVYTHIRSVLPWFVVTSEMAPGELFDHFFERGFSI